MFKILEIKSETEYKSLDLKSNAPFTQAWFYGEWQKVMGRKVRRFEIKQNFETIGFFQAIKYPMLFGQSFLYIPHASVLRIRPVGGEGGDRPFQDFLKEFNKKLFEIGKKENAIFARFDFFPVKSDFKNPRSLTSNPFLENYFKKVPTYAYHSSYFQPKFEWILDLNKTEEELLKAMHPKTRYGIRLAESRGVDVEIIKTDFQKYFPYFYGLMKKTAERNAFSLHPEIYYKNIFSNCEENKNAFLAIANYNNKTLAINLVLFYGEAAYFVFGASSDEFKNLMAPHLLHWKTIIEVKKLELGIYNFGAVGEEFGGVSQFKKRFGGELLEHSDSYDLVLKPFWYFLYNFYKRIR